MPFIHIRAMSAALSPHQARHLQERTTDLMAKIMRKKPELTSVLVEPVAGGSWMVGGQPQSIAAQVSIYITAGTNTLEEKARMIAAQMQLLKDTLGAIHPATYVVIHEIAGDAWGYDGLTQEERRRLAAHSTWERRFQRACPHTPAPDESA